MSVAGRTFWYFVSSFGVPFLGILTLPLYTTRLGPEQYGVFAIGSSLAAVVSAAAGSVSTLSLLAELNYYEGKDRRCYLGSVLLLAAGCALLSCLVVFWVYSIAAMSFGLELLSDTANSLMIVGAMLGSFWAICVEILNIEGRAKVYASITIVQTLVNIIVVCIALFLFNEIDNALFWGFAATATTGAIGATLALSGRFEFSSLRRWMPVAARGSAAGLMASLAENSKNAFERFYVGTIVGANQLGLLAHGMYYKNSSMILVNAVSRGLTPTSLREAVAPTPDFRTTLQLWIPVQAMVVVITLGFSLVGPELLGLLTHGKFVEATPYVIALMLTLLLQTSAKPQSTLMLARGQGHLYAKLNIVSILAAFCCLIFAVPLIGVWGVISAFTFQTLAHRVAVYGFSNRIHRLPFVDRWVIGGFILTGFCLAADYVFGLSLITRLTILSALYFLILWQLRLLFAPVLIFLKLKCNIK